MDDMRPQHQTATYYFIKNDTFYKNNTMDSRVEALERHIAELEKQLQKNKEYPMCNIEDAPTVRDRAVGKLMKKIEKKIKKHEKKGLCIYDMGDIEHSMVDAVSEELRKKYYRVYIIYKDNDIYIRW